MLWVCDSCLLWFDFTVCGLVGFCLYSVGGWLLLLWFTGGILVVFACVVQVCLDCDELRFGFDCSCGVGWIWCLLRVAF